MIYTRLNRTGGIESIKVHGGGDVAEVYGSINYAQPIFYSLKTLTGATSYSFMGYSEPLKSYEIDGSMVQSSTPTPTSPIYPQECGGRTRNVMPAGEKKTVEVDGVTFSSDGNGRYHISGTASQYSIAQFNLVSGFTMPVSVSNGGRGTLSLFNDKDCESGVRIVFYNGTTEIDTWKLSPINRTHTAYILMGNKYIDNIVLTVEAGIAVDVTLMPEVTDDGILPSEFEPYGYKLPLNLNGTAQNLYLTEPLRKIGDYADSINSDGTVTRRIRKYEFTGQEDFFTSASALYNNTLYFGIITALTISEDNRESLNSHFRTVPKGSNPQEQKYECSGFNPIKVYSNYYYMRINLDTIGSPSVNVATTAFKTWLAAQYAAGTPVTIWYVLAGPTTEQVTTPTITPATGNNTIAIGTTLQPSSVSITGHVKPTT